VFDITEFDCSSITLRKYLGLKLTKLKKLLLPLKPQKQHQFVNMKFKKSIDRTSTREYNFFPIWTLPTTCPPFVSLLFPFYFFLSQKFHWDYLPIHNNDYYDSEKHEYKLVNGSLKFGNKFDHFLTFLSFKLKAKPLTQINGLLRQLVFILSFIFGILNIFVTLLLKKTLFLINRIKYNLII